MRTVIFLLGFIIFIGSCKKDDSNISPIVYQSPNGTILTLTRDDWRTTKTSNTIGFTGGYSFLGVNLRLVGEANGDSVKIKTFGDGLVNYRLIPMDSNKRINADVQISFLTILTSSVPKDEFIKNTNLLVFKGTDTLNVSLTSGQLKY